MNSKVCQFYTLYLKKLYLINERHFLFSLMVKSLYKEFIYKLIQDYYE